jgi:hypothetical protein
MKADLEVARIDQEVIADGVADPGAGTGLPIMKLLTLRDRVEAACPLCHLGLPTPCGTSSPLLPPRPTYVSSSS